MTTDAKQASDYRSNGRGPAPPPTRAGQTRYLAPVIGDATASPHLAAACQVAAREGGQVVALVIGLVPRALPIGADVPERWSQLEYQAARARRLGRDWGLDVETVLVLSDSAGEAVIRLAEECRASVVCLAYEPGLRSTIQRWRDPLWRLVLEASPCPVLLERPRPQDLDRPREAQPAPGRVLTVPR